MRHITDIERHAIAPVDCLNPCAFRPVGGRMSLFGGGGGKSAPPAPAEVKAPQASKTPTVAASRNRASASSVGGPGKAPSSTFLTGSSGVDDSTLLLGKNKLLGE